ncbi:MAG: carbon-nitrogen family hydrolase [Anaerolineae bacterium]
MAKLSISLAQMTVTSGNERRNVETMKAMVAEAARRGSQLVVFPELWSAGYHYEDLNALAYPLNGGVFAEVASAASQHKICITGSMPEKRGDGINNSAPFFAPHGRILGVYRKIHLFGLMREDENFRAGQSPLNLELPWGKTGMAICYDLRFPEMFRRYGVEGSKLVILPAAWPLKRIEHWRALIRARAIENQYFMVACNAVGESLTGEGPTTFGGHSMIVDPWGDIVLEAGTMPGLYTAEIELDLVDEVRARIPVFEDRHPEYYGLDDIMSRLDL